MLAMQRAPWEQGVAAQACLEEGEAELAVLLAREAVLRQDAAGRLAQLGRDPSVTDPAAAGEAVVFAALSTGERRLAEGAERMLGYLLERAPRTADGVFLHLEPRADGEGELWIDSMVGLGATAVLFALLLPQGIWGKVEERFGLHLLPVGYRLHEEPARAGPGPLAPSVSSAHAGR
jgi:rhamnogalacturonyl hydrolase YesR